MSGCGDKTFNICITLTVAQHVPANNDLYSSTVGKKKMQSGLIQLLCCIDKQSNLLKKTPCPLVLVLHTQKQHVETLKFKNSNTQGVRGQNSDP